MAEANNNADRARRTREIAEWGCRIIGQVWLDFLEAIALDENYGA